MSGAALFQKHTCQVTEFIDIMWFCMFKIDCYKYLQIQNYIQMDIYIYVYSKWIATTFWVHKGCMKQYLTYFGPKGERIRYLLISMLLFLCVRGKFQSLCYVRYRPQPLHYHKCKYVPGSNWRGWPLINKRWKIKDLCRPFALFVQ